jgi:DNA mismatch endonuclease, patch repair protein
MLALSAFGRPMADKLTASKRSRNMAAIRSRDMKPELAVRSLAHRMGYRFRLHRADLPGKPDLVFPKYRAAVFVHGCFWHQHEKPSCLDGRMPKSNLAYWGPKLDRNVKRDNENFARLEAEGWTVLVIWECRTKDGALLARVISSFMESVQSPVPPLRRQRRRDLRRQPLRRESAA